MWLLRLLDVYLLARKSNSRPVVDLKLNGTFLSTLLRKQIPDITLTRAIH